MTVQSQTKTRRLSTCHRHPSIPITGFCASCLRERLAGIEAAANSNQETPSGSHIPLGSELRRSKSCAGRKSDNFSSPREAPRRRSCDVRARSGNHNSLWRLFNLDDERRGEPRKFEVELGNLGFELKEEDDDNENESDIRMSENVVRNGGDQADEEGIELKTMKEFIDLEWRRKKGGTARDFKDIAGTFWEAASGLSRRLAKWRRKGKTKKLGDGDDDGISAVKKRSPRRLRETQSEIGEYGLGRRSCDTDPRLSVDAGRMSLDDYRYSFDEPRASWDGYLMGRAAYPRLSPMLSVVEDAKFSDGEAESCASSNAKRSSAKDVERSPGGSAQTKDYYSESLSRRRRSFECPNSLHRKGVLAEVDDLKPTSNAKVSPATMELFYGAKLLITDRDLRDAKLKSVKDESLESVVESASKDLGPATPSGVDHKGIKKLQGWHRKWNLWGLKQRRNEQKCGDDGGLLAGANAGNDSWRKPRVANGEANGSVSQKLIRSYSVSCRNQSKMTGLLSNASGVESRGNVLNSREEFMLQRNRSARYSPSNADNGLLRFYLTPLRSHRKIQSGKSRLKGSRSAAKNFL